MKCRASPPLNVECLITSGDMHNSTFEIFATQSSHDYTPQNEPEINRTDDSYASRDQLLSLLGPDPKEPSPFYRTHISKRDQNFSPSSSSPKFQRAPDRLIPLTSKIRDEQSRSDKLIKKKVFPERKFYEESNNPYFYRPTKSFNNCPAMIMGLRQQEDLLAKYNTIPHQYLCIPDEQKAVLEDPNSWFRAETHLLSQNASIPPSASEALNSFLENMHTLDEQNDKNDYFQKLKQKDQYYNPESASRLNLQEFPFGNSQSIPTQLLRIPANQKALLDDQNSWFRPEPDTLILHSRIPSEVSEKLSVFLQSNLYKARDMERSTDPFNNEGDRDEKIPINQDHEFCNEDRPAQLELSNLHHGEDFIYSYNTRSPTPDVISRTSSIADEEPLDIRSQIVSDSNLAEIHKDQSRTSTKTCYIENNFQETFYSEFKVVYPNYIGSRRDFTWALVYIEWLLLQGKCLDSKLWDDFVRVLASDYLEDVSTRQTPITGIEYYKLQSHKPLFTHNLLSPQNIQGALRSLSHQDVARFRETFQEEPNASDEVIEKSPRFDLSHESESDGPSDSTGIAESSLELLDDQESDAEAADKLFCDNISEKLISQSSYSEEPINHQQVDLITWRQFLKSRNLAGALNPKHSATMKRYCTTRRAANKDPVV